MKKRKLPKDFQKRQADGIAKAKSTEPTKYRGRRPGAFAKGRSPFDARRLREQGHTLQQVADKLKISVKTVQRYLATPTPKEIAHWLIRTADRASKAEILASVGIKVRRGRIDRANDTAIEIMIHAARSLGLDDKPTTEQVRAVLGFPFMKVGMEELGQAWFKQYFTLRRRSEAATSEVDVDVFQGSRE